MQLSLIAVGILLLGQGGSLFLKGNELSLKGPEISMRTDFQAALEGEDTPITPDTLEACWLVSQLSEHDKHLKMDIKATLAHLKIQ